MMKDAERVKERIDVVDFLKGYIQLIPAGKNFKALCPFHGEKTPSFVVSPDRKGWHCFGCGLGGDVIKFLMLYENLEFPEALRFLAEKAGIPIQELDRRDRKEFEVLYDMHDVAKKFYHERLHTHPEIISYLTSRGITEDTIHEFELGFGEGGESLTLHLMKNGFSVQDIARSGLSNKNTSGMFRDKFIRRIMFPISNNVGKTVAFTGRIMPGEEKYNGTELPKYLNSPETPIFQKSKILYGFDKAKKPILDARAVVLVEGQMDFLMTWQTGVKNVVAVSGTGLTREHLDRLRKSADTIFMALDNDKAGIQALERNIETLGAFDFHARAIHLGEHKDPGDACLKDPEFMKRGIEEAKPAMEYVFDAHLKNGFTDMAEKKREVRFLISKIAAIRSGIERDTWMKELAIRSGIGEAALMEELIEIEREKIQKKDEREIPGNPVHIEKDGLLLMVEQLIFCSAQDEKLQKKLLDEINFIPEPYKSAVETKSGDLWNELEMRAAIELSLKGRDEIEQEFSDLLKKLKQHALKIRQTDLRKKLQFAEESGDEQEQQKILQQINELAKILHTL